MSERALVLGSRRSLVGILNEAAGSDCVRNEPVMVFLNSGIIHRVGGNRLTVEICRVLADAGIPSLRFDLSGIGDSLPRDDSLDPYHATMADIRDALDYLERDHLAHRFVLAGLCSGADHSIAYASSDPRVVGLVLIDPTIPRTRRYHVNRVLSGCRKAIELILIPGNWWRFRNAVRRRIAAVARDESEVADASAVDSRIFRQFMENAYHSALQGGRHLLVILTGGLPEQHNYREQLGDAFPSLLGFSTLTTEYFPRADHTFTSEGQRESLANRLRHWMTATKFSG